MLFISRRVLIYGYFVSSILPLFIRHKYELISICARRKEQTQGTVSPVTLEEQGYRDWTALMDTYSNQVGNFNTLPIG